jgi:purine-binding chemotaxis protein CheW
MNVARSPIHGSADAQYLEAGELVGTTQLVVFEVDGRLYALTLARVLEVVRMVAVTPVPEAPPWVAGVVNLRGRLISIVDLRPRLGLDRTEPDPGHVLLVASSGGRTTGILADRVQDVVSVSDAAIEQPGEARASGGLVTGLCRSVEGPILILDFDRLVADAEMADAAAA